MIAADIEITMDSPRESKVIYQSLQPELSSSVAHGIDVQRCGRTLKLSFKGRNTASMRAAVNSVLRWIMTSVAIFKLMRRE